MQNILIEGATSAIAQALARQWAQEGARLHLMARHEEKLAALATDLKIRGAAECTYTVLDANSPDQHQHAIAAVFTEFGPLDVALIAHGSLGDQAHCEQDFAAVLNEFHTNALSVLSLLTHLAKGFEAQGRGCIAVITSVAGVRGRQSNYIYGAAKGAVSIFLEGLGQRLAKCQVRVLDIRPGFVDTPMTAAFKKGPLWAQPEQIASDIRRALRSGKRTVLYTPWFWRPIMAIIRHLPRWIFHRLRL